MLVFVQCLADFQKMQKVNISDTFQKHKSEKLSNQLAHQPNQFSGLCNLYQFSCCHIFI